VSLIFVNLHENCTKIIVHKTSTLRGFDFKGFNERYKTGLIAIRTGKRHNIRFWWSSLGNLRNFISKFWCIKINNFHWHIILVETVIFTALWRWIFLDELPLWHISFQYKLKMKNYYKCSITKLKCVSWM
jgi:hypothetical protein